MAMKAKVKFEERPEHLKKVIREAVSRLPKPRNLYVYYEGFSNAALEAYYHKELKKTIVKYAIYQECGLDTGVELQSDEQLELII